MSPILLVFGVGMIAGNLVGGRLADRRLVPTLLGSLAVLAVVLGVMTFALHSEPAAVLFTGLLGAAAFATVAPLQLRVLQKAEGAGQSLASSFNIAAFNLGNAIGAWLGGAVIEHGPGLRGDHVGGGAGHRLRLGRRAVERAPRPHRPHRTARHGAMRAGRP